MASRIHFFLLAKVEQLEQGLPKFTVKRSVTVELQGLQQGSPQLHQPLPCKPKPGRAGAACAKILQWEHKKVPFSFPSSANPSTTSKLFI